MLVLFPGLSLAADLSDFEGGGKEAVVSLTAPGFETTVNLEVPAGYYATNATMKVTGLAAENNASAYPEGVTVKLDESVIWAFQQTGFGPMGRQDRFSSGQKLVNVSYKSTGGVKTEYIRLPKEANVQSAMMEVKGFPPAQGQELVNFSGKAADDRFGWYVSDAGDVNGDGFDDVIIGAPGANESGGYYSGEAYIYFGGPDIDNTADVVITGGGSLDTGIGQVAGVGDVNRDGYSDVGVCARNIDYIFFGGQQMDTIVDSNITRGSISSAGDVNNDGYDDVLIGRSALNKAYIYFGGAKMNNTVDLFLDGDEFGSDFGFSSSGAGDVNGDGYDDVIVSDWVNSAGGSDAGRAWLFFGGRNMDNKSDIIMTGATYERVGYDVSGAGDVNDDGYDDFIIGTARNRAYLYLGGASVDNVPDLIYTGNHDGFGHSVSMAGDMNNDGFDDVMVGAPGSSPDNRGCIFVYFGGNPLDNVSDTNFSGVQDHFDNFGIGLSGGGDVNGDGYADIVVGAPCVSSGHNDPGHAYVYTYHVINLTGILNPGISIGSKNIWSEIGQFNRTVSSSDFTGELNAYLASAAISGKDAYGNAYVDIPVNVNASGGGKLALSNLSIAYLYAASVPDFRTPLNDYLASHQNEKDANGNINVPLKVQSRSAGRIKLSGLNFTQDKPPALVQEIGSAELLEDSWNSSLIDLRPYYQDDIDPDNLLEFSVVSSTNSSFVTVGIRNGYLAADAFTGDANDNWTGTVEVVVACMDRWGQKTESNQFTITVKNVNDGPIITSSPVTVAEAGVPYFYNVTAVDGDNDPLRFDLTQAPIDMAINADTGQITWLPRARGNFSVFVTASDGFLSAEQRFTISVPNKAPRITSSPPLNATTGIQYVYHLTAEDDNLDPLTYSLQSNIGGMTIDSGNGTIIWTPQNVGTVDVAVQVSDGKAKATQDFAINVVQANRAPKFMSKPITAATVDLAYSYNAKATDQDNDVLTYSLETAPEGMTIDGATGKVDWTPSAAGNFTVKIKVNEKRGGEVIQEFVINVKERVKPTVNILRPTANEKVKGKASITGTAVKGTLEVASVQVRIDGGAWTDATGNYTWQYDLDTMKLKNGKHSLEARAFDGKDYSEIAKVDFSVDNQKAQGKGFIPGFETGLMLFAIILVISFIFGRRRGIRGDLQ